MFKGGAQGWLIRLLTIGILVVCSESSAQFLNGFFVPDYETLEWLFEAGLIDRDEFDRWNELFIDSLHCGRQPIEPLENAKSEQSVREDRDKGVRLEYRMYQRANESKPYRQIIRAGMQNRNGVHCSANIERTGDGKYYFRDRNLGWSGGKTELEIGGLDPSWCGGLVLGRHPIFLSDKDERRSLLYPIKGRFNGASLQTEFKSMSFAVLSSYDEDAKCSAAVHGFRLGYRNRASAANISLISGHLTNRVSGSHMDVTVIGGDLSLRFRRLTGLLDFSLDNRGNRAYLLYAGDKQRRHHVYHWSYSNGFFNPFGAGRSNSDTSPVEVPEIDLTYRSCYAGEAGIQTRSGFQFDNSFRLLLESNWWRTGIVEKVRLKTTFEYIYDSANLLKLILLAGDDDLKRGAHDLYSAFLGYRFQFDEKYSIYFSARGKSIRMPGSKRVLYWVDGRIRMESHRHNSEFLLRWYDPNSNLDRDHYVYCSARESFYIGVAWHVSVIVSSRFGPEQNALDKTRIQIETAVRF
jgi:hypothetical protein